MLKLIREFCQKTQCRPENLKLEWTPAACPKLVAIAPSGNRIELQIFAGLDDIAQVILLCVDGQEQQYPQLKKQQEAIRAHRREMANQGARHDANDATPWTANCQDRVAATPNARPTARNWRELAEPSEILKAFPLHPNSDDLLDLYELNKKFKSSSLLDLLTRHCQ